MNIRMHAGVVRKKGSVRDTVGGVEREQEEQQETLRERWSAETKVANED